MLAWSEFGAPRGFPIIYVHEAGSCRLEAAFFEAEARRSGFRLLAVDRPGLGESEGYAKMTRDSCADDLLQLSAHLGLKEFGILSSGAGLSIALAAAAQAPARVKLVLGVSSQLPVCSTQESRACRVLRSTLATALQCMLALRLAFANSTPEQYLRRLSESFAYADRRLLDDPAIRCKLTQSTCEAVRHGQRRRTRYSHGAGAFESACGVTLHAGTRLAGWGRTSCPVQQRPFLHSLPAAWVTASSG